MTTLQGITIEKGVEFTFKSNGETHTATIVQLKEKTFVGTYLEVRKINNVLRCEDRLIEFRYSGKKIHYRYTHSEVIEVRGVIS